MEAVHAVVVGALDSDRSPHLVLEEVVGGYVAVFSLV